MWEGHWGPVRGITGPRTWISDKKAQLCIPCISYLGYNLKGGKLNTVPGLNLSSPTDLYAWDKETGKEISVVVGYHHLWMPRIAELAKSLNASTNSTQSLQWTESKQRAFETLKRALISGPALALPDVSKPFYLYVTESQSIAERSLPRHWGSGKGQWPSYPKDLILFLPADWLVWGQFPLYLC